MGRDQCLLGITVLVLLLGGTLLLSLKYSTYSTSQKLHITSRTVRFEAKDSGDGFHSGSRRILQVIPNSVPSAGKTLYVITPTTTRSAQPPDLTRMAQTLRLANNVHWIVVENATKTNSWIEQLLQYNGLNYTLMSCPSPPQSATRELTSRQKNCGLHWLRTHGITQGVIYFGDDGNSYDYRLFTELLKTRTVSVFPVGHTYLTGVASPVVQDDTVVDFMNPFPDSNGKFQVDWSGFAVDVSFWIQHGSPSLSNKKGIVQTTFLEEMQVELPDLQPLANGCTEVLVWQLVTRNVLAKESFWTNKLKRLKGKDSNAEVLYEQVKYMMGSE